METVDLFAVPLDDGGNGPAQREAGGQRHEIGHLLVEVDVDGLAGQTQEQIARFEARFGAGESSQTPPMRSPCSRAIS